MVRSLTERIAIDGIVVCGGFRQPKSGVIASGMSEFFCGKDLMYVYETAMVCRMRSVREEGSSKETTHYAGTCALGQHAVPRVNAALCECCSPTLTTCTCCDDRVAERPLHQAIQVNISKTKIWKGAEVIHARDRRSCLERRKT